MGAWAGMIGGFPVMRSGWKYGGGTFKMAVQIVNVHHLNTPNNTCVFSISEHLCRQHLWSPWQTWLWWQVPSLIGNRETKASEPSCKDLQEGWRPFVRGLDKAGFNIVAPLLETTATKAWRSAQYSSKQLISLSQAKNIDTMCASTVQLAHTNCPSLVAEATLFFTKYKELFANCHNLWQQLHYRWVLGSTSLVPPLSYAPPVGGHIKAFMACYRKKFPHATVLPKMAHAGRASALMVEEMACGIWATGRARGGKHTCPFQQPRQDIQEHTRRGGST
jgi:hypothetical protein